MEIERNRETGRKIERPAYYTWQGQEEWRPCEWGHSWGFHRQYRRRRRQANKARSCVTRWERESWSRAIRHRCLPAVTRVRRRRRRRRWSGAYGGEEASWRKRSIGRRGWESCDQKKSRRKPLGQRREQKGVLEGKRVRSVKGKQERRKGSLYFSNASAAFGSKYSASLTLYCWCRFCWEDAPTNLCELPSWHSGKWNSNNSLEMREYRGMKSREKGVR